MSTASPLRLLVITSRPLIDANGTPITLLDVAEERRRIHTALHAAHAAVHVEYVPHATTGAVKTALRDPWDVVHFTGHGTADGRLVLEDEFGEAHVLAPRETAQLFSESRARLVVLSACHSEIIADALHKAGIPALVAIDARVPIADRAATIFAEHFYGALARGWTIHDAFRDAQESVALDAQVGDKHPPLDDEGKPETPWSQRFKLIGDVGAQLIASQPTAPQPVRAQFIAPLPLGNLRERNANFVGRAKDIVKIVKTFDGRGVLSNAPTPRVAIHGSGGIGKTELAKAVAWWYIERGKVDAVLWASASRDEGEFVLRDLGTLLAIAARAFRLPVTEQSAFDEQKRAVRDFCAAHHTLVLLDNWETLERHARKEIWDFVLSLPDPSTALRVTRVLVTSRDTLPSRDAHNYELDTLTSEDGARLFVNVARNAGYFDRNPKLSEEDKAILNAIVERLGGYPLAIEVVAGQTQSRALADIWRDLLQIPKNVLEGKDELTGEPRGVWTSLGFSYDVLPTREQTLFRRMGVFLALATAEDVAAIVGDVTDDRRPMTDEGRRTEDEGRPPTADRRPLSETQDALDTLVRRSLVRLREGTYALLPIVREYALSKLADAGEDARALHVRAVNYYGQKGTLDAALITSEHLFELASRFNERSVAEAFVKYVIGFYPNLKTRGYWADARRKNEQIILVARALGDKVTEAQAIGELGTCYQDIGEYARAAELYAQAQKTLAESGDKRGVAVILHQQGMLAQRQGDYAEAARLYRASLQIVEELGDKQGIASTLHALGMLAQAQGDYAEAARLYRASLKIKEELGDKQGIASTLHALGMLAQDQGDYAEAARLYRASLKIKEELGDKQGIAYTFGNLANLAYAQGNLNEAKVQYLKVLQVSQDLGDKSSIGGTYHQLGVLAQAQGDYAEAARLYRASLQTFKELGAKHEQAAVLHQLGMLAQAQGDYAEAARLYRTSLQIEEELGDKQGIASTLHALGMLAQDQGDYAEAARLYRASLQIAEELGDKQGIAQTLHQLGMLAQAQGDYAEAARLYRASLQIEEELGNKQGIAQTLHQLGVLAQAQGDYAEAARLYRASLQIEEELGDKQGIATTLGQLGKLARAQGQLKDALRYFLHAFVIFDQLHSPYRNLVGKWIAEVRQEVGEEQFEAWVKEMSQSGNEPMSQ